MTRHPGGPPGRPKIHPVFPRFALFFITKLSGSLSFAWKSANSKKKSIKLDLKKARNKAQGLNFRSRYAFCKKKYPSK
jgi:hypothetical protein